ncbi:MAG: L,D-transpeptidase/peptidoglycan binding protein [Oscillospiraceae bacterium]|nr:L,D-transpeptidase/peptidoglycan binding protein [Oscillospiraceae bacterium]
MSILQNQNPQEQPAESKQNSSGFETRALDVSVKDQPPVPPKDMTQKEKMAQIREALSMVNKPEPGEHPLRTHEAPRELPPLKKAGTREKRERNAAADTAPLPRKKTGTPGKQASAASRSSKKKVSAPHKSAPSKRRAQKQRRLTFGKMAGVIGGSLAAAAVLSYTIIAVVYQGKFLPHTYINALSVGGMTREEAHDALLDAVKVDDLTLIDHNGKEAVFSAADFSAAYSLSDSALDAAASEKPVAWGGKLFNTSEYKVTYDFSYSEDALKDLILGYDWGNAHSTDAHIVQTSSGDFDIEPETLGDTFDSDVLMAYVTEQLENGNSTIDMLESGCYEKYRAKITEADLLPELEIYNRFARCSITFDFSDRTKVVDGKMIVDWILTEDDGSVVLDDSGEVMFDVAAISQFVAQMADETDTYGHDRSFYATLDGWINVPWTSASNYGWQIDQEATVNQIVDLIREGESVTVDPKYCSWGYGYVRATDDIGTTYVEVDISAQHIWVYKNNTIVLESDCVSGTETDPERRTPRGINQIWSHESPRVLGRMEVQGYETLVQYWMPFNYVGCGFHDLGRSAYGGSIYMYNGSHGCINLPLSVAKEMYSITFNGMPVIVHD